MADLFVQALEPTFCLASVQAFAGRESETAAVLGRILGFEVTDAPLWRGDADAAAIGVGPGAWLVLSEAPALDWPAALANGLDSKAAVADQSGGYRIWRFRGPGVRDLLQSGVFLDLHPKAFAPGAVAATTLAHMSVTLWRRADADVFEAAVPSSYADAFATWLGHVGVT